MYNVHSRRIVNTTQYFEHKVLETIPEKKFRDELDRKFSQTFITMHKEDVMNNENPREFNFRVQTRLITSIIPEFLCVTINRPNVNLGTFVGSIASKTRIKIMVNAMCIFSMRLDMCCFLESCKAITEERNDDAYTEFMIKLPVSFCLGELFVESAVFTHFDVNLITEENDIISRAILINKYLNRSQQVKNFLSSNVITRNILIVNSYYTKTQGLYTSIPLDFEGNTNGHFIYSQLSLLSNIKEISLYANQELLYRYNNRMLRMFAFSKTFDSDNILYIPLNDNVNFRDNIPEKFVNSFNQGRINFRFEIETYQENDSDIGIISFSLSKLSLSQGLYGIERSGRYIDSRYVVNIPAEPLEVKEEKKNGIREDVWNIVGPRKLEDKIECPISYEPILKGDLYCICETCKMVFSMSNLTKFFQTDPQNQKETCPNCRQDWKTFEAYRNE